MAIALPRTIAAPPSRDLSSVIRRSRMPKRTTFKVLLKLPIGNRTISCADDESILEAAEAADVELPFSCRVGSCPSCVGRLELGSIDQGGNAFLDHEHVEEGYVLTCIAYPTSNVTIRTHMEDEYVKTLL